MTPRPILFTDTKSERLTIFKPKKLLWRSDFCNLWGSPNNNFGRFDDNMMYWKNDGFHLVLLGFQTQLAQKILKGILPPWHSKSSLHLRRQNPSKHWWLDTVVMPPLVETLSHLFVSKQVFKQWPPWQQASLLQSWKSN